MGGRWGVGQKARAGGSPPPAWGAGRALAAASASADDETSINKRVPADPAGQVEVSNTSGSVVVTGWDSKEVEGTGGLGRGARERGGPPTRPRPPRSSARAPSDWNSRPPANARESRSCCLREGAATTRISASGYPPAAA